MDLEGEVEKKKVIHNSHWVVNGVRQFPNIWDLEKILPNKE